MSNKLREKDKKQQLESNYIMQVRRTYLREEVHGGHWACSVSVAPIKAGMKYAALRTADGILFIPVSDHA